MVTSDSVEKTSTKERDLGIFLRSLWRHGFDGYLTIWTKKNKKTEFVPNEEIKNVIPCILSEAQEDDIYFGLGLVADNGIKGRGKNEDIIAIPGLWLDVDIGTENHSSKDYPETVEDAMEIIKTFPFEPTIIVHSGHGLHLYWVFKEPLCIENSDDRGKAAGILKRFLTFINARAKEKGYKLDNISDLARMLRLPGTFNHKGEDKKEVTMPLCNENKEEYYYDIEEIEEFLQEEEEKSLHYYSVEESEKGAKAKEIIKKCRWMRHCKDDSKILSEPEWFHMLTVIACCDNSEYEAYELSRNYPKYSKEETDKKLEHARDSPGPVTCKYINENFSYNKSSTKQESYCKACKSFGRITSPIQLGVVYNPVTEVEVEWPKEPVYKEWIELLKGTPFVLNEKGYLCFYNKEGEPYKIANFIARPVKEIVLDNGVDTKRYFQIEGVLEGGIKLPTVEIDATQFASLDWLLPSWGIKANMMPIRYCNNIVRSAIQYLSKNVVVETKYAHIGWRKIQGKWCYLHSKGCIGTDNITVALDSFLESYSLPEKDETPEDSLRASLELIKIGPLEVTLPLLSLIYLAPLTDAFRRAKHEPNFLLWLYGRTGTRKTSIATLFLSHFREYSKSAPASFKDTANAIEKKAFHCKDSILLIDDYYPSESRYEKEKMSQTAQHLIRLYGDKIGKGRMMADTSIRTEYPPRGMALITGEDFITGHSSMSRCLGIELHKEDVNLENLTKAQENYNKLSKAMRGYIEWLLPKMDKLPEYLGNEFLLIRKIILDTDNHGRMIETVAWLQIGYKLLLKYAKHVGIYTEEEIKEELNKSLGIFISLITSMHNAIEEEKPEILFIKTLMAMLDSGDYIVESLGSRPIFREEEPKRKGRVIGWKDNNAYYLIPEISYGAVCEVLSKQNKTFPGSMTSLLKCMDEAGLIKTEEEIVNGKKNVKRTVKKSLPSGRKRLIHIYKDKLNEAIGF